MKLAVIAPRFPWPIEKGDKLRIYYQIKSLAQHHEILLISIVDEEPTPEEIAQLSAYCQEIHYFKLRRTDRWLSALFHWFSGKPAQVGYFYSGRIKQKVYQKIIAFEPDRIYCQLIRAAEYVKSLPFIKILDYMDTLSSGMLRQSEARSFPSRLFFQYEARLSRRYERSVYSFFDETIIISDRDRSELPLLSKQLVHVIPNGINTEHFVPSQNTPDVDLVFVGNLGYKPNEQAVLNLLEWTQDWRHSPPLKILIAGARPSSRLLNIRRPGWEIAGWVDDIRDAYGRGKIFVAPLTTGSGLQNKLLEAMSMGLACVSTSLVNDSIEAQPNEEISIANTAEQFSSAVQKLLSDEKFRLKMGQNARNFVLNKFQWNEFNRNLNHIITNAKSKSRNAGGSQS